MDYKEERRTKNTSIRKQMLKEDLQHIMDGQNTKRNHKRNNWNAAHQGGQDP